MEITVREITQTTRPSLTSRNHVWFNFFFNCRCYNYRHRPHSPSPEFTGLERFKRFAYHKQNLDKSFSDESIAAALDKCLAALICCRSTRKPLVECAIDQLLRAWQTEPLCRSGCRFSMDINLLIETVCHHVYHDMDMDVDVDVEMVPAAQSSIRSLNKLELEFDRAEDRSCSVCLEDFVAGEELVSMPCEHIFHGGCIHKWLSTSHYCPLCRFQMPTAVEFVE